MKAGEKIGEAEGFISVIYDADMILKKVLDLKGLVPPITPKITPV
ncbi:MAG: hypothetical protein P8Y62_05895 [candidate division WOR-3 bacterium]